MVTRSFVIAACFSILVASGKSVDAQIVRFGGFGGVSIRAPFVAVDVLPYGGGTRVRAPFTRVNTGAYRYGSYYPYGPVYYPAPPVIYGPPPVTLSSPPVIAYPPAPVTQYEPAPSYPPVDIGQVADRLRRSAARLAQSLSLRRNDADVWLDYLGPNLIVDVIDRHADPSNLRGLIANYDGVVSNGSLASIRSASGFSETRTLLKQFVASPAASSAQPASPAPQSASPAPQSASPAPQSASPAPQPEKPRPTTSPVPKDAAESLNPFADGTAPRPKSDGEAKESDVNKSALPIPPPPTQPPPPRPTPINPQADGGPTPAEPIKTASETPVPTPL